MLGIRSITGTGLAIYALIAVTASDAVWIAHASGETLHQVFVVWLLAAAFVGAINWIFD